MAIGISAVHIYIKQVVKMLRHFATFKISDCRLSQSLTKFMVVIRVLLSLNFLYVWLLFFSLTYRYQQKVIYGKFQY